VDPQGYRCPGLISVPMMNQGPLTIPGRALSDHHHPLQQANPAQGLVPPHGGFDSEGAGTSGGVTTPSMTPRCEPLRCPLNEITG
jgi:hypothetical protein